VGPASADSVRCLGEPGTQGCDQSAGGGVRLAPEPAGQAGRRRILVGNYLDRARRITCECTDLKTTIRSGGPLSIQARVEASDSGSPRPRCRDSRGAFQSNPVPRDGGASIVEKEPNESREQAQPVPTPAIIEGKIATVQDSDMFRFHVAAGE